MHDWNVLRAARWKYKHKNYAENRHLRTITRLCQAISWQLTHVSTIENKLVKQQYLIHMSSQYGELWPTNVWDRLASLGHPSKFQGVSCLGFATVPLMDFCQVQNSLSIQVLLSPILAALLHGSERQPNFAAWYKEWNYGTFDFQQRAPHHLYSEGSHHVCHRPTF